jgi:hypothetical protein
MAENLYVVRVNARREDDGCPRDAFFGSEPVLYRYRKAAEARARELSTSGEWGEAGPPSYYDEECEADDLLPAEYRDYEEDRIIS